MSGNAGDGKDPKGSKKGSLYTWLWQAPESEGADDISLKDGATLYTKDTEVEAGKGVPERSKRSRNGRRREQPPVTIRFR